MSDFDQYVSRDNIAARVPEDVSNALLHDLNDSSAALRLCRRITVPSNVTRFPVLSVLPAAYWVDGDTGLKATTQKAWANKYLYVEELAAIVPVPDAVLDDSSFDIFGEIKPSLEAAIARKLDAAVFFGEDAPTSWSADADIAGNAVTAGNTIDIGTSDPEEGGVAQDFNLLFAEVEEDGFDVNGVVAAPRLKASLRGARDTSGQLLADVTLSNVLGAPLVTDAMRGMWTPSSNDPVAIAGDFTQAVIGIRQDITYKVLDQAVITDDNGSVVFNLPQQDMVALRVVFRAGFAVSNPITWEDTSPSSQTRYPFATLLNP